jgi:hypothetical protein
MAPIAIGGRSDEVAERKPVTDARTIAGICIKSLRFVAHI